MTPPATLEIVIQNWNMFGTISNPRWPQARLWKTNIHRSRKKLNELAAGISARFGSPAGKLKRRFDILPSLYKNINVPSTPSLWIPLIRLRLQQAHWTYRFRVGWNGWRDGRWQDRGVWGGAPQQMQGGRIIRVASFVWNWLLISVHLRCGPTHKFSLSTCQARKLKGLESSSTAIGRVYGHPTHALRQQLKRSRTLSFLIIWTFSPYGVNFAKPYIETLNESFMSARSQSNLPLRLLITISSLLRQPSPMIYR